MGAGVRLACGALTLRPAQLPMDPKPAEEEECRREDKQAHREAYPAIAESVIHSAVIRSIEDENRDDGAECCREESDEACSDRHQECGEPAEIAKGDAEVSSSRSVGGGEDGFLSSSCNALGRTGHTR